MLIYCIEYGVSEPTDVLYRAAKLRRKTATLIPIVEGGRKWLGRRNLDSDRRIPSANSGHDALCAPILPGHTIGKGEDFWDIEFS